MEYMSKEGYDKLMAEYKDLIEVQYPKIKDALAEARAQGDLSENAEYRAARRAQAQMMSRIRFLERVLDYTRVVDTSRLDKDIVGLLSKVEFTNLGNNVKMKYQIVSHHEANLQEGKISIDTPIAKAMLGKKAGDVVEAHVPAGVLKLRIDSTEL